MWRRHVGLHGETDLARDPWTMRENEDTRVARAHLLDVVVRACFVARLFAAINYAASREGGFSVGLGRNTEDVYKRNAGTQRRRY